MAEEKHKTYGLVEATVTDIVHDKGEYRVRLKYPKTSDADGQSWWARIVTIGAGKAQGIFWLPEKDDTVLVAFVGGDFDQPVVVGSVWNGNSEKTTYSNKDADGKIKWASFQGKVEAKKNDVRVLTSRKFHQLIFNDNSDEPRVAMHSSQKHRIVLDDKGNEPNKIEIYDGKEENYILIDTKNKKITIESKTGDILIKAKEKIRFECKTMETKSDQDTKLDVGANYEMKAKSNMTIKASGSGDIESSGTMTFKGATVNIN